jgi:UDP-2,4-diacetamido-2,4,6-trideoxy-beta-L-altropyranose hydrolase
MIQALLVRADAGPAIGVGHVMRCLALARHWLQAGGQVVFAQNEIGAPLAERLRHEGAELLPIAAVAGSQEDARETVVHAKALGCSWIVADGYAFDAPWQQQIKAAGFRLLLLDDYRHARHYHADVVLNQNASASAELYANRDTDTRLLLGSKYALLRREFTEGHDAPREIAAKATKILVTLGGSDPFDITGTVVAALAQLRGIESVIVVGGGNPRLESIRTAVGAHGEAMRIVVNAPNMAELMAWADVAVSAAGSTAWELACMGLPAALIVVAENQAGIAAALAREGVSLNLGPHTALDAERIVANLRDWLPDQARRKAMSVGGRRLVDGQGAKRVLAVLNPQLKITIVSDADSWSGGFIGELKTDLEKSGHTVRWLHDPKEIEDGDVALFLSLGRIVSPALLKRHAHNLVVHASALPHGRGWSPLTWQILEGRNEIPVSLLEAADGVDSGDVYAQRTLRFQGYELLPEMHRAVASATMELCGDFIARYPFVVGEARTQEGEATYYPRRRPGDSRLDPDKTLREQFNLLRVCDQDRYPALVEIAGRSYQVRITPAV